MEGCGGPGCGRLCWSYDVVWVVLLLMALF